MATRWQFTAFVLCFMPVASTNAISRSASVANAATFAAEPLRAVRVATGFEFTEGPVPDQAGRIWFSNANQRSTPLGAWSEVMGLASN